MSADVFVFALVLVGAMLALAAIPAFAACRSASLYASDFALVIAPAPLFLAALELFNEPAYTDWALIEYPFFIMALCVVVFYGRVFLLPHLGVSPRRASVVCCLAGILGAITFGAFTAPLGE